VPWTCASQFLRNILHSLHSQHSVRFGRDHGAQQHFDMPSLVVIGSFSLVRDLHISHVESCVRAQVIRVRAKVRFYRRYAVYPSPATRERARDAPLSSKSAKGMNSLAASHCGSSSMRAGNLWRIPSPFCSRFVLDHQILFAPLTCAVLQDRVNVPDVAANVKAAQSLLLHPHKSGAKPLPDSVLKHFRRDQELPFTKNVVCVSITGPGRATLTIVDLPCIVRSFGDRDAKREEFVIKFVDDLMFEYIKKPTAIIICVRPPISGVACVPKMFMLVDRWSAVRWTFKQQM
jgi:hypothetical protein